MFKRLTSDNMDPVADLIEESHFAVARRVGMRKLTKNKFTEFPLIIEHVLHDAYPGWIDDPWRMIEYDTEEEAGLSTSKECLCSHKIRNLCFVEHQPSRTTFLVGSCCMFKVMEGTKEQLRNYLKFKKQCVKEDKWEMYKKLIRAGQLKPCIDCDEYYMVDNINQLKWKTRCLKCYKRFKRGY